MAPGDLEAEFSDVRDGKAEDNMNLSMGVGIGTKPDTRAEQALFPAETVSDDEVAAASAAALARLQARKQSGDGAGKERGKTPDAAEGVATKGKATTAQSPPATGTKGAPTIVKPSAPLPALRSGASTGSSTEQQSGNEAAALDGTIDADAARQLVDEEFNRLGRHLEGVVREAVAGVVAENGKRAGAKPRSNGLRIVVLTIVALAAFGSGWIMRGAGDAATHSSSGWSATPQGVAWMSLGERNPNGSRRDIVECSVRAGLVRTKTARGTVCAAPGAREGWLIP